MTAHTWHPNTFGLLYGKTTKTACGRRAATKLLVKPLETTCIDCQTRVIADLVQRQELHTVARDLMREASAAWSTANPELSEAHGTPLEMYNTGAMGMKEFCALTFPALRKDQPIPTDTVDEFGSPYHARCQCGHPFTDHAIHGRYRDECLASRDGINGCECSQFHTQ